jgi:hypothetical protein
LWTAVPDKIEEEQVADFNPYLSPPNIKLAELHGVTIL